MYGHDPPERGEKVALVKSTLSLTDGGEAPSPITLLPTAPRPN
jgi:hypothetical protein